jgi:hypothetical protein
MGCYRAPLGRLTAWEVASEARSHVGGSCPLQPTPPGLKSHSLLMGGGINPPPSTTSMYYTMQNSYGIPAWSFSVDSGSAIFMVFRVFILVHLGPADPLQTPSLAMPRQRMRPRRGSPWHPRRPRTPSSLSDSSTPDPDCLAVVDTSWTLAWHSPPVKHAPPPPEQHPRRPRPNPKTNPPSPLRGHSAILQDLVFELREGVNDLQFRVQQMEGKLSTLLQLIADPPPVAPANSSAAHESSSDPASSHHSDSIGKSPQFEGAAGFPVPRTARAQKATGDSSEPGNDGVGSAAAAEEQEASIQEPADKGHNATDMQWTAGGTPIIEEPCPGPMPEYVPEYTMLVPYFSSSGSHGR